MKVLLESETDDSKSIRIPSEALKAHGFGDEADLTFHGNKIVISPINSHPRKGWEEAAKEMAANGDNALIWPDDQPIMEWGDEDWSDVFPEN